MELEQLKVYLKCAVDMEAAIYACQEAIHKIELSLQKKTEFPDSPPLRIPLEPGKYSPHNIPAPIKPTKPVLATPAEPIEKELNPWFPQKEKGCGCFSYLLALIIWLVAAYFVIGIPTIAIGGVLAGLCMAARSVFPSIPESPLFIISMVLGVIASIILFFARRARKKRQFKREFAEAVKQYEIEKSNANKKYQEALLQYERDMLQYEQDLIHHKEKLVQAQKDAEVLTIKLHKQWQEEKQKIEKDHSLLLQADKLAHEKDNQMRTGLNRLREDFFERKENLKKKLEEFYNNGPIYPSYRNMIAVTQLYEYIASGIAPGLEGPDGAYSQYMLDVRTERIRGSINQLQLAVVEGFQMVGSAQYIIMEELKSSNHLLRNIEYGLDSMHSDLNKHMTEIYNETSATTMQLSALGNSAKSMSNVLSHINTNTQDTAMNTAIIGFNQYLDMKSRGVDGYYSTYGF